MALRSRPYAQRRRRLSWPLLTAIAVLHVGAIYGLAHLLVPDMAQSIEREVIAAFDISEEPPPPPPPENTPEPDEGAQGDPGKEATASAVSVPASTRPDPPPLPRAASTGTAARSGAREAGDGTGAAGIGFGTGSGNAGRGRGGVAVTKPVHISGSINDARDYPIPAGGRGVRNGTEVIVRVIVGVDGRARNCSIYKPSPDPQADQITCQLVTDRLGFRPAQDANGNPVAAPYYWRQRWF